MEISKKDMKVLLKSQQGELDAVLMYNALSKVAKMRVKSCSVDFLIFIFTFCCD